MNLEGLPGNLVFYDGVCGLCHHTVKFVIKHDKAGIFSFSALQGDLFTSAFSETEREKLPDSIVLITEDKKILTRSSATVYILKKLGGVWRYLGIFLGLIPCVIRDTAYILVAHIRRKIFKQPDQVCPIVPDDLKGRFI